MRPSLRVHTPFVSRHVDEAPASPGVFLLYRTGRLIYIGFAAPGGSIRERLREHLRGQAGSCTRSATEFDFEASPYPRSLYRHYFAVYLGTSAGRLPECNKAVVNEVPSERSGPCPSCRK
ncbi:MAG TPA: hypothetical protein VEX61_13250 [Burkholderiales bacterium]|nr:hypothetical protein [Burkholderiales bacterium]